MAPGIRILMGMCIWFLFAGCFKAAAPFPSNPLPPSSFIPLTVEASTPNPTMTPPKVEIVQKEPAASLSIDIQEKENRSKPFSAATDFHVKGVYIPYRHLHSSKWTTVQTLLRDTDLNAVVIDAKTDGGRAAVISDDPLIKEMGFVDKPLTADFVETLKDQGIYTIARVVTFKDPNLADMHPELAIQDKNGKAWQDRKGVSWVDPYQRKIWDYNIQLARAAASIGFDEIQFDYVRFPENAAKVDQQVTYANPEGIVKSDLIAAFLQEAKKQLTPTGVRISADVFGITTSTPDDNGIGQNWNKLSPVVDVISPMIYPSHYSKRSYGIAQPDLQPYLVIQSAMREALAKNEKLTQKAIIRPWLQDFTAKWVKPHQTYGTYQVKEQVKALEELGISEFLLWNPNATYTYN